MVGNHSSHLLPTQQFCLSFIPIYHKQTNLFIHFFLAEARLRDRVQLLQRWRRMGITTLKEAQEYEREMERRVRKTEN